MPDIRRYIPVGYPRVVMFTRGDGTAELAELLATSHSARVDSDVVTSCVNNRADLVVTGSRHPSDLVASATGIDFDPAGVRSVVAAVSGGQHSRLAARIAARLGKSMGVPAEAVSGYRNQDDKHLAMRALAAARGLTGISARATEARSAGDLVDSLEAGALLVIGAAGGSWLQRQFFGAGARLIRKSPAGTVIVRSAPVRAFQCMEDLHGFGPHLRAEDAMRLAQSPVTPVVEEGLLIGVVRHSTLANEPAETEIGGLIETAPHAVAIDAMEDLAGLESFFEGSPIPVVDKDGRLVGGVSAAQKM